MLFLRFVLAATVALGSAALAEAAGGDTDAEYAARLSSLVNRYRVEHGLLELTLDANLSTLAREHSGAMAKAGRMGHDDFASRVRRSGLAMCVENVGWNYGSPAGQFAGWRKSPGHDANMLDKRVERMGVGMVADYVTLIACGK